MKQWKCDIFGERTKQNKEKLKIRAIFECLFTLAYRSLTLFRSNIPRFISPSLTNIHRHKHKLTYIPHVFSTSIVQNKRYAEYDWYV